MKIQKIDKANTIIAENYIWMSKRDKEMPSENKYTDIDGVLVVSDIDENLVDFIKTNKIYGLEIKGDKFTRNSFGLSILKDLKDLKYLRISGKFGKSEYKAINYVTEIEELSLAEYEAYDIDFSKFKYLKAYFSPIKHYDHPVFSYEGLKYLGTNTTLENINIEKLKDLKELFLFARKLKYISGIDKLRKLHALSIVYGHNLTNISNFSHCKNLSKVAFSNCKKLSKLDDLANISNLKCLSLQECGEIESLKPLVKCKYLEYLSFGSTTILDGDIASLEQIKSLKGIFFRNKKHYNRSIEAFNSYDYLCSI